MCTMRSGHGGGALVPSEKSKQRCPKGPTRFLLAVHSFVRGYFSANKFNIYFQQVAGGRVEQGKTLIEQLRNPQKKAINYLALSAAIVSSQSPNESFLTIV